MSPPREAASWLDDDDGAPAAAEPRVANLFASEKAIACAPDAIRIHGGDG